MKKILFFLLVISLSALSANAQEMMDMTKELIRSPQVADMMRFDKVGGVSKLSGRLDLNIEVARIKDKDFDLPVTLRYNSAGFMPSKPESYVGLNWSLSAGGMITREVKGVPDDITPMPREVFDSWMYREGSCVQLFHNHITYGFSYFVRNKDKHVFAKDIEEEYLSPGSILGFPIFQERQYLFDKNLTNIYEGISTDNYRHIEASSDIYHFNFGHHSGKFLINFDGSVSVISNNGGKYKVDLSDYNYAYFFSPFYDPWEEGVLNSTIKIITDDGYIYSFGGSFDNVEYSYSWNIPTGGTSGLITMSLHPERYEPHISSYYLYRIEAPNGRVLNIEYASMPTDMHSPRSFYKYLKETIGYRDRYPNQTPLPNYKQNFICSWHPQYSDFRMVVNDNLYLEQDQDPIHNLTKIALIKRIFTDSQEVVFEYEDSAYSPFDNLSTYRLEIQFEKDAGALLNNIITKAKRANGSQEIINTANFAYKLWNGTSGSRQILSYVYISSIGKYEFKYNVTDLHALPSPLTPNIDFWNYWRGHVHNVPDNNDLEDLIPRVDKRYQEVYYGSQNYPGDRITSRSPGDYGMDIGMLNCVIFPTGGSMEIEYESNEYDMYLKRTDSSFYKPALIKNTIGRKAGGVRVKKITRGNQITSYLYQNSISDNTSSGILINEPQLVQLDWCGSYGFQPMHINNSGFDNQSYEEDHIRYSSIIEVPNDLMTKIRVDDNNREILLDGRLSFDWEGSFKNLGSFVVDPENQLWTLSGGGGHGATGNMYIIKDDSRRRDTIKHYSFGDGISDMGFKNKTPKELGIPAGSYDFYLEKTKDNYGNYSYGRVEFIAVNKNGKREEEIDYSKQIPNGYIIEKYIDRKDIADGYSANFNATMPEPFINRQYYNHFLHTIDKSYMRGKIKATEMYDNNNNIIKKDIFGYCNTMLGCFETAYYYNLFAKESQLIPISKEGNPLAGFYRINLANGIQKVPVELGYRPLESKTSTEYFYDADGNLISKMTQRETFNYYNDNLNHPEHKDKSLLYLKYKWTTTSDGSILLEDYTYSYEQDPNVEPYKTMIEKNMLNTVVQHDVKKNEAPLYSKKNNYVLKELPLATEGQSGSSFLLPMLDSQELTVNGNTETRTRILRYDGYGNAVHVESDSNNVFYLWSYRGQYPIVEVRGCNDYNIFKTAVETCFGISINEVPYLYDVPQESLTALQNHASMAKVHITTALYKPLVGVRELTDPSGKKFYYEYDTANRLSAVYKIENGEKVIVNSYQYNLKNR